MQLLISVRNLQEAAEALAGGAAVIDVKEPNRGSLGAAEAETIAAIHRAVGGQAIVSAALGELFDRPLEPSRLPAGLAFAKLGLSAAGRHAQWSTVWGDYLRRLPATTIPVAVAYADWRRAAAPPCEAVIEQGARFGCGMLLIDTWQKDGLGLLSWRSVAELASLIAQARQSGMRATLAGALQTSDIARLRPLSPDYLAFRGAACPAGRTGAIDQRAVAALQAALASASTGFSH